MELDWDGHKLFLMARMQGMAPEWAHFGIFWDNNEGIIQSSAQGHGFPTESKLDLNNTTLRG